MNLFFTLLIFMVLIQNPGKTLAAESTRLPLNGKWFCTKEESWDSKQFGSNETFQNFERLVAGQVPPVLGFATGLAFRKISSRADFRLFAEYWVSRSLYEAKMVHLAQKGFISIIKRDSRDANDETAGVQLAAVGCLVELQREYPSMDFPIEVVDKLPVLAVTAKKINRMTTIWAAAETVLLQELNHEAIATRTVEKMLKILHKSGLHEEFAQGLWTLRQKNSRRAIEHFRNFVRDREKIPVGLKKYTDLITLLLARSYYQVGKFEKAVEHFREIGKSSNELIRTLSDLSWALLLAERYPEAVGAAMNLQVGSLRRTFAPESVMVMAMALNELCQYPESLRAINLFKKFYEESFRWLSQTLPTVKSDPSVFYANAIKYLKREKLRENEKKVPEKLTSEWVKSPVFQSNQLELNLYIDEVDSSRTLARSGSQEQRKIALQILEDLRAIKPDLIQLKKESTKPASTKLRDDIRKLRKLIETFEDLQDAAPIWRAMLSNYRETVPAGEATLRKAIDRELEKVSKLMLKELENVAENVQLIEVEIYNGASQDMIWQNAHPEYKEVARDLAQSSEERETEKTWNWGKIIASTDEDSEVWEDELGAFKSNLFDNCSNKERFLALKFKKGRSKK